MDADNAARTFEPSDELSKAILFSLALSEWLVRQNTTVVIKSDAQRLAITHLAIALDHREGFHLLTRHGAFTPALALMRPIYESLTRGTWAYLSATPDECKLAYTRGVLPKFETIVKRLDKLKGSDGEFGKYRNAAWEPFSDFSHGGMRQVSRWTRPDAIAPHHRDEDVIDAMTMADILGVQASIITSMVLETPIDDGNVFFQSVAARYWARKGKRPPSG